MNTESIHSHIFSVAAVLRMDHDLLSPYYSFPLFVADYELHNRKIPVINFIHDGALITDPVKLNQSGKEMVRQAFSLLRQKESMWQQCKVGENLPFLVAESGSDDSIAEKILDPVFMQQACALLGTQELEVALPHTGIIMARAVTNEGSNIAFNDRLQQELSRIQVTVLTDLLFRYTDDHIVAVVDCVPAKATTIHTQTQQPEAAEGELVSS